MPWEINIFETLQGRKPVESFIRKLPAQLRAKLVRDIDLLADFGPDLGAPYVRKLTGTSVELWELRTRRAGDHVRTFFHVLDNERLLLLHCFRKKSRAAPKREIQTAEERLKLFIRSTR